MFYFYRNVLKTDADNVLQKHSQEILEFIGTSENKNLNKLKLCAIGQTFQYLLLYILTLCKKNILVNEQVLENAIHNDFCTQ